MQICYISDQHRECAGVDGASEQHSQSVQGTQDPVVLRTQKDPDQSYCAQT